MSDDRPVTLTLALPDGTVQAVPAEAVEDTGPRGFFTVTEPAAVEHIGHGGIVMDGEELLLVPIDRVVGIEGPAAALDTLIPPAPGEDVTPTPTNTRGGDPEGCPECGGTVADSLGGSRECIECGWAEDGDSDE